MSIITYGSMVHVALESAAQLEAAGVQCEVIDLRTLMPLDEEAILTSVAKTGKAVLLHEDRRTGGIKICLQERVGERPHGEPRRRAVLENRIAVAHDRDRRMEHMHLPAQQLELVPRRGPIDRLGEAALPERQRLVRAEHKPTRRRHGQRLLPRQQGRNASGIAQTGLGLNRAFVDISGNHLDRDAGTLKQGSTAHALGCQQQRLIGKPECHDDQTTGCRRRSASSLSTAAAVSSIEQRVTSMLGQLCLAQSLRENATSSATALRSIY